MFWNKKFLLILVLFLFFSLNAFGNGVGDLPRCTVNQDGTQKTCHTKTDCDGGRCFQEYRECFGPAFYPTTNPTIVINPRTEDELTFNYPFTNPGRSYTKFLQTGYITDYECVQGKCTVTNRTIVRIKCLLGCDIETNKCVCPEQRPDRYFCKPGSHHIWMETQKWDCTMEERLYKKCPLGTECGPSQEHPLGLDCISNDSPGPIQGPDGKWYASINTPNNNTYYATTHTTTNTSTPLVQANYSTNRTLKPTTTTTTTTYKYYKPTYTITSPYPKTYYRSTYSYTPRTTLSRTTTKKTYSYKTPKTSNTHYTYKPTNKYTQTYTYTPNHYSNTHTKTTSYTYTPKANYTSRTFTRNTYTYKTKTPTTNTYTYKPRVTHTRTTSYTYTPRAINSYTYKPTTTSTSRVAYSRYYKRTYT